MICDRPSCHLAVILLFVLPSNTGGIQHFCGFCTQIRVVGNMRAKTRGKTHKNVGYKAKHEQTVTFVGVPTVRPRNKVHRHVPNEAFLHDVSILGGDCRHR